MDWSKYIAVNSATAHPHYDREGATYNMGNSYGKTGNIVCFCIALFFPPVCPLQHIFMNLSFWYPAFKNSIGHFHFFLLRPHPGFFYNIIRVPPPEEKAAVEDSADLTGASVICSIPASEPRKPSYYHSFGEVPSTV